jgi:type VI secretion system secreted protein VgrG
MEDSLCPWAIMRRPFGFGGNSSRSYFAVPEVGSSVWVSFLGGCIYSPVYETAPVDGLTKISEMETNYPKRWGWTDPDGSSLIVDVADHTVDYVHQSGTEIHILKDKTVNIIMPYDNNNEIDRDRETSVGRDETIDIQRNKKESIVGNDVREVGINDTETITGNKTSTVTGNETKTVTGNITITATGNVVITGATVSILPTTPGVGKVKLGAATPIDFVALQAALVKIKTDFDAHTHSGVQTGGGTTGAPSAPMTTFVSGTDYTSQVKAS